ncbi:hypothetical protein HJ588_13420 [Flexivirga sp. ID2601S]|uniref:Uncharacterized protein n=1 Tax=Flexivirga aerilata TaxID=1656889 RepID=A0A849AL61_9MICO|nr:hypothetical protein [Flexivirga aerilata]NNG40266.1 hypothetical protein [Flexivirga aerilata]
MPEPTEDRGLRRIEADLYVDPEANMATIFFTRRAVGEQPRTLTVRDADGEVVAALDFLPDGRVLQLELHDLQRQGLPEWRET